MKKENIHRLYQLMLEDDEMLMGSQWEEMYCNEYDTPKSILDNFINIYLTTSFVEVDDDLNATPLANQEEKIMALIKYLEKIIKDLKNKIEIENNDNDWGGRMKLQVKFDFVHNLEKQMELASEKELREYRENPEAFIKKAVEKIKKELKNEIDRGDYAWIENLDVKVVEEWNIERNLW